MSYIAPNSIIQFLSDIPFDVDYENTMYFANGTEQNNYMLNHVEYTLQAQSYTRVNRGVIRVGIGVDNSSMQKLFYCNYMRFVNSDFEAKWWYAFIDSVEYVNNNTVEITFHIDVLQTFIGNLEFNQCLIEREHVIDDGIGAHTLPEGLETGEYRSWPASCYLVDENSPTGLAYMHNRFEYQPCVILACALDNTNLSKYTYGITVPGIATDTGKYYSGVKYYAYKMYGGGETQGIYQFNFGGTWYSGNRIYFNSHAIYLDAEHASTDDTVAETVAYAVNEYSYGDGLYFAVHSDYGVITVYETTGHYGSGIPTVRTDNSETGIIYSYTIQDGSAGSEYGDIDKLNNALQTINSSSEGSKIDAVVGLFMMPLEFYPKTQSELTNGVSPLDFRVYMPTDIDGYTPRNKKLFCYPYNVMYETNNTGAYAEYRYENFIRPYDNGQSTGVTGYYTRFKIWGNISMNPGMYCAPAFYNGNAMATGATDDELVVTGFPMCSYNVDSYKAWLAQNAGTITAAGIGILGGWASAIAGGAIAGAGLTATGAMSGGHIGQHLALSGAEKAMKSRYYEGVQLPSGGLIASTLGAVGQLYDHSRRPPQVSGHNNANLAYQAGQLTFSFYNKQIKAEYARIIDAFFDMYGYKTNRVGTPLLATRTCYTYVKTVGCSLKETIPNDFLREIEGIFNKGVRFWRTNAVFGSFDPSVNNNTVLS